MNSSRGVTDATLIDLLRAGDPTAFATVYDRHQRQAFTIALGICRQREAAEDVVQQAFLEIWRTAERFDPTRGSAASWILTIVRHRAIDAHRRQAVPGRRVAGGMFTTELAASDDTVEQVGERHDAALVRKALRRLPAAQRATLYLAYGNELSHTEIATALDVPIGTVKSRTRLGLATLRRTPEVDALSG